MKVMFGYEYCCCCCCDYYDSDRASCCLLRRCRQSWLFGSSSGRRNASAAPPALCLHRSALHRTIQVEVFIAGSRARLEDGAELGLLSVALPECHVRNLVGFEARLLMHQVSAHAESPDG